MDDQPPVRREARTQEDGVLITLLAGDQEVLARGRSITVALPQAAITYPLTGSFAFGSKSPSALGFDGILTDPSTAFTPS